MLVTGRSITGLNMSISIDYACVPVGKRRHHENTSEGNQFSYNVV